MRLNDWEQRQLDTKSGEELDRAYEKAGVSYVNADMPADANYLLTRLQGQLIRLAEVNTKGRHLYSDEELHSEIASIVNEAQNYASQLRSSFDRKRFDVA